MPQPKKVFFSIYSMKNASSRYSGHLIFCMSVDDNGMKYCAKLLKNAPSILEATPKNRVISIFTVSKKCHSDTVKP